MPKSHPLRLFIALLLVPLAVFAQTPQQLQKTIHPQSSTSVAGSQPSTTQNQSDSTKSTVQFNTQGIDKKLSTLKSRYSQLVQKEPIAISGDTFSHLWSDIVKTIQGESTLIAQLKASVAKYFSSWNHMLNLLLAILIVITLIAGFAPIRRGLNSLRESCASSQVLAVNSAGYVIEVASRSLPTLLLMFGAWMVALVLDLKSDLLLTIFRIAAAVVVYKLLRWFLEIIFAPEEIHRRLVAADTQIAQYFFRIGRSLLQWTLLYAIVLFVLQYLDYRQDFRYFLKYVYRIGAILLFAVLFLRRDYTLSLFPETSNKFYDRLIALLKKSYYLIYIILILSGLLSVIGYFRLSTFIFSRVFYTIGIIILSIFLNRVFYDTLDWIIPKEKRSAEEQEEKVANFWKRIHNLSQLIISAILALFTIVLIAKVWWLLGGQSIGESLVSLFTFRLFSIQSVPITPWSLIKAVLIFVIFLYVSRYFRRFMENRILDKTSMDSGAKHAVLTITHYIILIIGFVVALEGVGIELTTLKVFAGALGLGIGFGLQNIANNFASGLIILFERPIKNKDFVQVKSGGSGEEEILGTITKISARSTTILTRDNIAIIVPNSNFIEQTVVNWSLNDTPTRVHIPIGVQYGTNPEKVRDLLLEIASNHKRVLKYPRSKVWFNEFGESSLNFNLLVWIKDPQQGITNIKSDINFEIAKAFKEEGIGIPFPQRDVHFKVDTDDIQSLRQIFTSDASPETQNKPETNKQNPDIDEDQSSEETTDG